MEKKTISVHALTVHIYTIAIAVLLLLLIVLGLKYLHLKLAVQNYTQSAMYINSQGKSDGQLSDYGLIIASSVSQIPQDSLENYILDLSKSLKRDIVVMNKDQKISADTINANVGKIYSYDSDGNIKMTIGDGKTRSFQEKSADYPQGLWQMVIPITNSKGDITGVILLSSDQLK